MGAVQPSVRVATSADATEAARLLDAFNREFDTPTPGTEILAARLQRLAEHPALLVLLVGDPAVGLAVVSLRPNVWFEGPVGLIDELYVAPAHRDRGLGSALIHRIRREMARRGVEELEIDVDDVDTDAQRFYRRHGFREVDPDTGDRSRRYRGAVVDPANTPAVNPATSAITEYE
jgi:ribosomal protein S18 acetylase RimI-like enzyme